MTLTSPYQHIKISRLVNTIYLLRTNELLASFSKYINRINTGVLFFKSAGFLFLLGKLRGISLSEETRLVKMSNQFFINLYRQALYYFGITAVVFLDIWNMVLIIKSRSDLLKFINSIPHCYLLLEDIENKRNVNFGKRLHYLLCYLFIILLFLYRTHVIHGIPYLVKMPIRSDHKCETNSVHMPIACFNDQILNTLRANW